MRLKANLRKFPGWLGQVLRKWWVWLGLFPLLLHLVSAYIPPENMPSRISSLLEVGANWQLTLVLVTIGMLISAFLVYSETDARLAAYEYQAPEYDLKPKEITCGFCGQGCHVEVRWHYTIRGINPFEGNLARITIDNASQIRGLGHWEISHAKLPKSIPNSEVDLEVVARAKIQEAPELDAREEWESAKLLFQLVIEYFTQPVGYTRRLIPVNVQVDLGKQFDALFSSRKQTGG
jgi:hypothetical protein